MDQEHQMNLCDELDRSPSSSLLGRRGQYFLLDNRPLPSEESPRRPHEGAVACGEPDRREQHPHWPHNWGNESLQGGVRGPQKRRRNQTGITSLAAFMGATSLLLSLTIVLSAAPQKTPLEDHRSDPILHPADEKNSSRLFDRRIQMHGRSLELHLAHPGEVHSSNVLVLYASGDGGWFGAAVKMFEDLTQLGYPAVGFSARAYMKLLGYGDAPVSLDQLGQDYLAIICEAQASLNLPQTTRTILTGWSRGAAFAVLVGSEKNFQHHLAGVIAIGLPDKEELKIRIHDRRILVANASSKHQQVIFDTYQRIPLIAPLPFSLIQSTRDDFLPASEARKLFGSESETDKFFAVEARNHRFSGGAAAFGQSLRESVRWIIKKISTPPAS
jgi:hypothetical protein